ncbi:sodium:proton antiporter NhaD [Vreelandella venusta]|uniref:Sodium:proton antiporter n=1 Tax=Vreelandella venusta TaxID=44935 RepID=A0AAP9ZD18_9GAMM|nr:sodium:proton antiporter NhaD [Halomonas venusta]MBR9924829.1 sodium:proton antiporter [Gammaproteobacteria bacterium]AZM97832.1 sodium:proton antiporter [Halomonas venusta]MDW0360953.1 sodium:proton antiporter NhaD [Halomonas venusta]MDX1353870.1 sodium:proton antiporter NhaD [Halomonas venusta]MDX1713425.1 sodium:proton antiporter NhaD [Halomonas venusta]
MKPPNVLAMRQSTCRFAWLLIALCLFAFPTLSYASSGSLDLTASFAGIASVVIFVLAYALVMSEELIHMRKSKPVLVAAGLIWALVAWVYVQAGMPQEAEAAFKETLLEYTELLLFLLVAMTYINAMEERRIFDALRAWLVRRGFSYRSLFWITGCLAFGISAIANNMTTAMLMCAVVLKVAEGDKKFISLCCVNVVVASNAGGAFSPFGDITTLMVWQAGQVPFGGFFALLMPAIVNFMVPAVIMNFFIVNRQPASLKENVWLKRGARRIIALFLITVAISVLCHSVLYLPPAMGMMFGLGLLQFFGYYLRRSLPRSLERKRERYSRRGDWKKLEQLGSVVPFDIFSRIARSEWDTLLFFYGVVMCVGGLGFMGYLSLLSETLYGSWNPVWANVVLGMISAVVDNIPVMFAVLSMAPDMSEGNWLLITLTAGVGGSLLSMGSAAGVALMGQARGIYTFMGHIRWAPAILLGYAASIVVHLWINAALF